MKEKNFSAKLHKTVAIPVEFHSKDEMLGCRVHAVNKHNISSHSTVTLPVLEQVVKVI